MRVNSRVFEERTDMFSDIRIPNCPSQLKQVAEQIVMLVSKPGYSTPDYNNITELDKLLIIDYWVEYDSLQQQNGNSLTAFRNWFVKQSTSPDLITRARRWLVEHNYLILKPDVQVQAMESSEIWKKSVRK